MGASEGAGRRDLAEAVSSLRIAQDSYSIALTHLSCGFCALIPLWLNLQPSLFEHQSFEP